MFYETAGNRHGLARDPFKAIVVPRPIGWIGTRSKTGVNNLGPYSFFNAISDRPKLVMFSSSGYKDSARNAEETGCFTCNFVSRNLLDQMNQSSAPYATGVDEFQKTGLAIGEARLIEAPYVAEAFAVLECKVTEIMQPKGLDGSPSDNWAVFGEVVGIHIREEIIVDGKLDMRLARPVARMGYMDYAEGSDVFEVMRPTVPD